MCVTVAITTRAQCPNCGVGPGRLEEGEAVFHETEDGRIDLDVSCMKCGATLRDVYVIDGGAPVCDSCGYTIRDKGFRIDAVMGQCIEATVQCGTCFAIWDNLVDYAFARRELVSV